jgi:serine/threonine protein kinase
LKEDVKSRDYISLGDFTFLKCLGSGASANVFLVRHRGNGRLYALKQVDKGYFVEFKRMEQILREKKIMTEVVNNFPFMA